MSLSTTQKITYSLVLIGLTIIVTVPDVVFGFIMEIFHLLFELVFILFEWLESTLDHLVEHLFHTDLHTTQIIVFYLILTLFAYPAFYLWQKLNKLCAYLKDSAGYCQDQLSYLKADTGFYWQGLPWLDRAKVFAIVLGSLYLASFFFM
ncbi:MAG: hypothetical protein HOP34_10080 [Methylococcaceae bacterium]|nr:hypothetical protein [Methylococcaceae bacterium]